MEQNFTAFSNGVNPFDGQLERHRIPDAFQNGKQIGSLALPFTNVFKWDENAVHHFRMGSNVMKITTPLQTIYKWV